MVQRIVFYTNKGCPYAQRAHIALLEANASFEHVEIDLQNKPSWYNEINAALKVPAVVYGGPFSAPVESVPEGAASIPESLVLLDFIADVFPDAGLLPVDPVQRAKVRLFIDAVGNKFGPAWAGWSFQGKPASAILDAVTALQAQLSREGDYFLGSTFSIADIALAPFVQRFRAMAAAGVCAGDADEGKRVLETLEKDAEFERWRKWESKVLRQSTVKSTYPGDEFIVERFRTKINQLKAQA